MQLIGAATGRRLAICSECYGGAPASPQREFAIAAGAPRSICRRLEHNRRTPNPAAVLGALPAGAVQYRGRNRALVDPLPGLSDAGIVATPTGSGQVSSRRSLRPANSAAQLTRTGHAIGWTAGRRSSEIARRLDSRNTGLLTLVATSVASVRRAWHLQQQHRRLVPSAPRSSWWRLRRRPRPAETCRPRRSPPPSTFRSRADGAAGSSRCTVLALGTGFYPHPIDNAEVLGDEMDTVAGCCAATRAA